MKRIYYVILLIMVTVFSLKCQKELSSNVSIPARADSQSSPVIATVQGNILDDNGQPASGVIVSAGLKKATTDPRGYFRIVDAPLDKNTSLITAEKPGFFKAFRTFKATTGVNQIVIQMIKKTIVGTVNAATGGKIIFSNNASVSLPANGINELTGETYTGKINVYADYIDPGSTDIGKIVPGSFMADDKDKNRVTLSSYGMLVVELESTAGEKLQIKPGNTASLTIPIPSSLLLSAPAEISLWYMDEQTGIWKEEGSAKKTGNLYTGNVHHFSYWNSDISEPGITFSATFKTSDNLPLVNLSVMVRPSADSGYRWDHGYTDSLGQVSGVIPAGKSLVLEALNNCGNVVYTKNIGPFEDNTDLGTIVIPDALPSLLTIKGKLSSCNNTAVTHGFAAIYLNNFLLNATVNSKGEFSANMVTCVGVPQTCEILGVDENRQQQGNIATFSLTSKTTDVGNISACGTSSAQFINYTLDGTDHTISSAPNDSLVAFSYWSGTAYSTFAEGFHAANDLLSFSFLSPEVKGTYPLNALNTMSYTRVGLIKPFNVNITAFPQNPGEFYEGNFSGNFVDSAEISIRHQINCSFRIKKY